MKKKLMNITICATTLFMFHCASSTSRIPIDTSPWANFKANTNAKLAQVQKVQKVQTPSRRPASVGAGGSSSGQAASGNQPEELTAALKKLIPTQAPVNKNYEGQTLQGQDCNFSHQDLRGVNFKNATLTGCKFKGAFFGENTQFDQAQVEESLFSDAIFFKTDLSGTTFSISNFKRTKFHKVDLFGTSFSDSRMRYARFTHIKRKSSNSFNIDLHKTVFEDVSLNYATFFDTHFNSLLFSNVRVRYASFAKASFKGSVWKGINASNSTFNQVDLIKVDLRKAKFRDTKIINSDLDHADVRGADFSGTTFSDSSLKNVNFRKAYLYLVDFGNSNVERVEFRGSNIKRAKLHLTQNFHSTYQTKGQDRRLKTLQRVIYDQYTQFPTNFSVNGKGMRLMQEKESSVKCVFERPFIMGASISAGFSDNTEYIGGLKGQKLANAAKMLAKIDLGTDADSVMSVTSEFIRASRYAAKGISYHGSDKSYDSPTTQAAIRTNLSPHISNISEIIGDLPHKQRAYRQLKAVLNLDSGIAQRVAAGLDLTDSEAFDLRRHKKYFKKLKNATVLASIDGFYWPSTEQDCENQIPELLAGIDFIIDTGKQENKPVILGTVPAYKENMMHSSVIHLIQKYAGGINFPKPACYTKINAHMKTNCTVENGCYLLDVHQLVETYKQGNTLNFENVKITFNISEDGNYADDVHPVRSLEGMHLSPIGSRYIATLIENLFIEGLKNSEARYLPRKVHRSIFSCSRKSVDLSDPAAYATGYTADSTYLSGAMIQPRDEIHRVSVKPLPVAVDLNDFIIALLKLGL